MTPSTEQVAANDEMQHALESQASVLKEQLAAEREVRRKVETELKIARNQLGQEAARREVLERLVQAMQDKFRVAGINFSLPTGICLPSTASQHADNGSLGLSQDHQTANMPPFTRQDPPSRCSPCPRPSGPLPGSSSRPTPGRSAPTPRQEE